MEELAFPYVVGGLRCISKAQNSDYREKDGDCVKNYSDDDFFESALNPPGKYLKRWFSFEKNSFVVNSFAICHIDCDI